jgi:hypothetical protein
MHRRRLPIGAPRREEGMRHREIRLLGEDRIRRGERIGAVAGQQRDGVVRRGDGGGVAGGDGVAVAIGERHGFSSVAE